MPEPELKSGDLVVYRDLDQVQWGPWEVTDVKGNVATVAVDKQLTCPVDARLLRKVEFSHEVV